MAYYPDWSSVVIFGDELSCLRYAVEHHMTVAQIGYGIPLGEQIG